MQEKSLSDAAIMAARISESLSQVISDYIDRLENTDGHTAVLECIQQTAESLSECLSELQDKAR